jgi:hypothetical protein
MRPKRYMRNSRLARIGAGAMMLGTPASAIALTAGQADAQSAPQAPVRIELRPSTIAFGDDVVVTGRVATIDAGQPLALEYAPARNAAWRVIATTRVGRAGRFRFVAPLRHSGSIRVAGAAGISTRRDTAAVATTGVGPVRPSTPRRVTVDAALQVPNQQIGVLGGQSVDVRGKLLPGVANRKVQLIALWGGSWHWLASTWTGPHGGFDLHYATNGLGREHLLVKFAGDRRNGRIAGGAGTLTVYRQSVASWYNDGGSTACGFHATYGVANKSLACGTQVTFQYGGRSVTATVDDRGPYVGGREWDLNQNTAAALGFGGVGTVWSSI